jgi:hypothetical protein
MPSATFCLHCPPGRFVATDAQAACSACAPVTFNECEGNAAASTAGGGSGGHATACGVCPSGKFQLQRAQASCAACAGGRYQLLPSRTSCSACARGMFRSGTAGGTAKDDTAMGAGSKFNKPAGTHVGEGHAACRWCPAGKVQSQRAQSSCALCGAGRYCPRGGCGAWSLTAGCQKCAEGQASHPGASKCRGGGGGGWQLDSDPSGGLGVRVVGTESGST